MRSQRLSPSAHRTSPRSASTTASGVDKVPEVVRAVLGSSCTIREERSGRKPRSLAERELRRAEEEGERGRVL